MPHINRIRVNNVKYNFGTQFYDDFILRFDGKNALYDLANGGGKSVLMLLLFQNLIPNCTLDDKQPIEKLFRTDQGSKTIHSLIEWKLDDRFCRDNYKYMLTGFCARKAREELRETAAIEYFNYIIFYRNYNDYDLVNLPLTDGAERITYTGLKTSLKELGRREMGLEVHIFEKKGEYQRFISNYGLYESQWEILRGINKTEGHVRTYFENRYKTTRKVIEDLLIEEIIQRAYLQNSGGAGDMADTLVQIKEKLSDLAARREEINYYDRQAEILESFSGRVQLLKNVYAEKEALDTDFVKTYHTVVAANRLKEKDLALHQKEKANAQKHIEEISRKLDTAKVQKNQEHLQQLETDTKKYEDQLQRLRIECQQLSHKFALAESRNDYIHYLEIRNQWSSLKEYLSQGGRDDGEMLQELRMLARMRRKSDYIEKKEIYKKIRESEKDYEQAETLRAEAVEKERGLFSSHAILEARLETAKSKETIHMQAVKQLCVQVPVLALENVGQVLQEKKQFRGACEFKVFEIEKKLSASEEEQRQLRLNIEKNCQLQKETEREAAQLKKFLKSYDGERKKRDKLLEIYRVEEGENLAAVIREQLKKTILEEELKRRAIKTAEECLEDMRQGSPVSKNPAVREVIEYLRRCHNIKCVFGADYLKDISDSERRGLLERFPFLPESVIIESGMTALRSDKVLQGKDLGNIIVPIIGLNQVLSGETEYGRDVLFLSGSQELFMDGSLRETICKSMEKSLEEEYESLKRLEDRERTITEDLNYVSRYEFEYESYFIQRSSRLTEISLQADAMKHKLQSDTARVKELEIEKKSLEDDSAELKMQLTDMDKEIGILEKIKELSEELTASSVEIRRLSAEILKNENQHQMAEEKLRQAEERKAEFGEQKKNLYEYLNGIESEWKNIYELYYEDGEIPEISLSREEADSRFKGLKEAFEKGRSDLEDKKRLMDSYAQMMGTALQMIKKRGVGIELLDNMYQERRLMPVEADILSEMEKELLNLKTEISNRENNLRQYLEDKNKLFGSVSQGITVIEEKYGRFQKISFDDEDYGAYAQRQRQAMESLGQKLAEAEAAIQKDYRELRVLDDIKRELERMLQSEGILLNRTQKTYGPGTDIHKKYRELMDNYRRLSKEIQQKRENYERDKQKTIESLRLLSAAELSEAVKNETGLPSTSQAAGELIWQLNETIGIVRLEKERIEKTIQDMVQIKENFEKQCLQRCVSIRAELERFPSYSRITLDGRQIPMVVLKIPYIKEEMYAQRMSEYIDDIIDRTESYKTQEEKVAYIRRQLAWKRLFSVIVTDMNSIRLSLYKRERVKEQSRYLKYEEAVGSTGQSQGIYIQFLIGIINYISMVYSGGGDGGDLQKVIFIDNPFGAAKDIYIWQPIFELLRTNHVQLIVPTRGATPAITGRFDVNYVLGQKMIDKMQQTVVVDFSSNVDTASLAYERLEFEQEVFDFI